MYEVNLAAHANGYLMYQPVADIWDARDVRPPHPPQVIVFHFHAVFNKNYVRAHPPLGNPGSATAHRFNTSALKLCKLSYLPPAAPTNLVVLIHWLAWNKRHQMELYLHNLAVHVKKRGATVMKILKPVFKIIKDNYYQEKKSPVLLMTHLFRQVYI